MLGRMLGGCRNITAWESNENGNGNCYMGMGGNWNKKLLNPSAYISMCVYLFILFKLEFKHKAHTLNIHTTRSTSTSLVTILCLSLCENREFVTPTLTTNLRHYQFYVYVVVARG